MTLAREAGMRFTMVKLCFIGHEIYHTAWRSRCVYPGPPMASGNGELPWFHRLWWLACAGLATSLVAARELHYLRLDWPLPVAQTFDWLMHLGLHSVIVGSITLPLQLIGGLALV